MFFDADTSEFDRLGKNQIFSGHVVAIAAGTLVSADRISVNRDEGTLSATGHVVILNHRQVLTGETLVFDLKTRKFTLSNARMVNNDPRAIEQVTQNILGFTPEELAFEASREAHLTKIGQQKTELQQQYRNSILRKEKPPESILERYIVLLEQEKKLLSSKVAS